MDSLRVDNGIRKIEVNDAGECIEFSVTNNDFFKAFSDMIQWFEAQDQRQDIKDMKEQGEKVVSEDGEIVNYEALDNVIAIREKISKEVSEKIDAIFGVEASRKIFGGIVPSMYEIADFFEKITPFIEKYTKERNQTISKKYNKGRKGAKS
ncbi:hypothetical protein D3Z36_14515 [Lachnospiraceae bacterium]|nr:hypothetical protein [Lachnospiraceae bacterium]